jgi:hypothetical protein
MNHLNRGGKDMKTRFFRRLAKPRASRILSVLMLLLIPRAYSQRYEFEWTKQAGGSSMDFGKGIAVDRSGNAYVTGYFCGTAAFGPTTLTSEGGDDIFIAKLNSSGDFVWAKRAGGKYDDNGEGIAVDGSGNVYVTGSFWGAASFGSTTLSSVSNSQDIFGAKLDGSGNWLWVNQAGGSHNDEGFGIAVNECGNVFLTGYIGYGTSAFGSIELSCNGDDDIFVAKLGDSGNFIWARSAGGSNVDRGLEIAADGSGNVYVTGYFQNTVDFGSITLSGFAWEDVFIAKLNSSGDFKWARRAGGSEGDFGYGIAVDDSGNVFVTGSFKQTAVFGSTTLTSSAWMDLFAAKLNNAGHFLWAVQATGLSGGASGEIGYGIDIDRSGRVLLAGPFSGTADFGSTTLTDTGNCDIFIAKLSVSGSYIWAKRAGGTSWDQGMGIAVNAAGRIFITGEFQDSAVFGSTTINSAGSGDIFIAKLKPLYFHKKCPIGSFFSKVGRLFRE